MAEFHQSLFCLSDSVQTTCKLFIGKALRCAGRKPPPRQVAAHETGGRRMSLILVAEMLFPWDDRPQPIA